MDVRRGIVQPHCPVQRRPGVLDQHVLQDRTGQIGPPTVKAGIRTPLAEQQVPPVASRRTDGVGGEGDRLRHRALGHQRPVHPDGLARVKADLHPRLNGQDNAAHHRDVAGDDVGAAGQRPDGVGDNLPANVSLCGSG